MWFFKSKSAAQTITKRAKVAIRMEAIGGQGANSAGKILAEAAVLQHGYTGNHFSSFGSEKRGSPVRSFVRFSTEKKPVRSATSIQKPDLLIIFHESLLNSHQEVLDGADENTDLILNTNKKPQDVQLPQGVRLRQILTLDASKIAESFSCGLNAVVLGVVAELCPELLHENLELVLSNYFQHLPEKIQQQNLKGFRAANKNFKLKDYSFSQSSSEAQHSPLPEMGWLNAPIGGVILNPGNSALKDHSASRKGVAPRFVKELCFNCGFCDMVCPDFCFVWKIDEKGEHRPELQGVDYQYCKGCQKCVTVCPVQALIPVAEHEIPASEKQNKVYSEVDRQKIQSDWQNQDWPMYIEQLEASKHMMSLQTELLDPKSYLRPEFPPEIREKIKKEFKK